MKLKFLSLVDFQAHEELEVKLSSDITSIVGPTDAGKSSILRALRWACLNDLGGDAFIREGTKKTRVELGTDFGTVRRVKGSGLNSYELNDEEFKAFGQGGVPQDIANALNLSEVNFQGQHDSPFWFSETAGEVSRRLNAIVNLNVIDECLSNVAAEVRKGQIRLELGKEKLTGLEEEFAKIKEQANRVTEFETLKEQKEQHEKVQKACDRLAGILEEAITHLDQQETFQGRFTEAGSLFQTCGEGMDYLNWCEKLSRLISEVEKNRALAPAPPSFAFLEEAYADCVDVVEDHLELKAMMIRIEATSKDLQRRMSEVKAVQGRFEEVTKGKSCPICGKPLP